MPTATLTPIDLAGEAVSLIRKAREHRDDGAVQRELIRETRALVADLRDALARGAFNDNHRDWAKEASEALAEAFDRGPRTRGFWLSFAELALLKIAPSA